MPVVYNKKLDNGQIQQLAQATADATGAPVVLPGPGGQVKVVKPDPVKQIKATITTELQPKDSKPLITQVQEVVGEAQVPENPAVVNFLAGRKFSDGNYGSFSVSVGISVPCDVDYGVIEQTWEFCRDWVDGKLQEMLKGTPGGK